jgi:hypothetical protein
MVPLCCGRLCKHWIRIKAKHKPLPFNASRLRLCPRSLYEAVRKQRHLTQWVSGKPCLAEPLPIGTTKASTHHASSMWSVLRIVATTDRPATTVHYGHACVCHSRFRPKQANHRPHHCGGPVCTDHSSQTDLDSRCLWFAAEELLSEFHCRGGTSRIHDGETVWFEPEVQLKRKAHAATAMIDTLRIWRGICDALLPKIANQCSIWG